MFCCDWLVEMKANESRANQTCVQMKVEPGDDVDIWVGQPAMSSFLLHFIELSLSPDLAGMFSSDAGVRRLDGWISASTARSGEAFQFSRAFYIRTIDLIPQISGC